MDARQPLLGWRVRPDPMADVGADPAPARLLRAQPCRARHAAERLARRRARDHLSRRLEANERIVRAAPLYAKSIRLAIVHHTATPNVVHARPVGGDRQGDRALPRQGERVERHRLQLSRRPLRPCLRRSGGGITRNVVGAQAQGFNTGSVGVAVIGNFTTSRRRRPTERARAASRLAAGYRPRRPAVELLARLPGQSALPGRRAGRAARDLRSSRH